MLQPVGNSSLRSPEDDLVSDLNFWSELEPDLFACPSPENNTSASSLPFFAQAKLTFRETTNRWKNKPQPAPFVADPSSILPPSYPLIKTDQVGKAIFGSGDKTVSQSNEFRKRGHPAFSSPLSEKRPSVPSPEATDLSDDFSKMKRSPDASLKRKKPSESSEPFEATNRSQRVSPTGEVIQAEPTQEAIRREDKKSAAKPPVLEELKRLQPYIDEAVRLNNVKTVFDRYIEELKIGITTFSRKILLKKILDNPSHIIPISKRHMFIREEINLLPSWAREQALELKKAKTQRAQKIQMEKRKNNSPADLFFNH